jgi:hypothetical protein
MILSGKRRHFPFQNIKKPGGRAGLRKFARATRSMFGSVRAARAPQDDSLCFVLGR